MIASIPSVQSAHDFFMDAVFVFGIVPMYLNFATRIVTYIRVVICSCVLFARHEDMLILSAFTSWPVSLVVTYKASLFFYNMYVYVQ